MRPAGHRQDVEGRRAWIKTTDRRSVVHPDAVDAPSTIAGNTAGRRGQAASPAAPHRPPVGVVDQSRRLHRTWVLPIIDVLACLAAAALLRVPPAFAVQIACTLVAFACLHLYRRRLSLNVLDDAPSMLAGVVAGHLTALALAPQLSSTPTAVRSATLLGALLVCRTAGFAAARAMRHRDRKPDRALIFGAGHVGIQLGENLLQHPEYGVTPVGYIDANPRVAAGESLPAPLLEGQERLAAVIHDHGIRYVMVAYGGAREEALVDILRTCDRLDVEVFVVPRLFELHSSNRDTDDIWGIPLLRVRRAAFRSPWWRLKRIMDVVLTGVALVLLAPVLLACAIGVRLEGGPGLIFRQVRVGLDGRPFHLLKFRSLRPEDEHESSTAWNIQDDARLGPVGRFLRRSSLDELPQLWNILKGDMSLVGPRPERPYFVDRFSSLVPRYTARHRVPAGLTGWAQVHGLRGDTSIEHRAKFDNYYIENWSLWLDVKIIVRTINQVLRRGGG